MALKLNGSKHLLWIGGAIVICVSVSVFLFQLEKATCPLPLVQKAIEEKIDLQYNVIKENIADIKKSIEMINSKIL